MLAQALEHRSTKLGELVEEQDPVVREARFTGLRWHAAADEAGGCNAVVRGAEGPVGR